VYALPVSDSSEHLTNVYNCLIESTGSSPVLGAFPRQFGPWKDGGFLHEPISAHIRPTDSEVDRFTANSVLVYFKVSPVEPVGR